MLLPSNLYDMKILSRVIKRMDILAGRGKMMKVMNNNIIMKTVLTIIIVI